MRFTFITPKESLSVDVVNRDFTFNKDLVCHTDLDIHQSDVDEYKYYRENLDYGSDNEERLLQLAAVIGDKDFEALLALRTDKVESFGKYLDQYTYSLYDFVWTQDNIHKEVICDLILKSQKNYLLKNLASKFMYTIFYKKQSLAPANLFTPKIREVLNLTNAMVIDNKKGIQNWKMLKSWSDDIEESSEEEDFDLDSSSEFIEYQTEYFDVSIPGGYATINSPGFLDENDLLDSRGHLNIKLYAYEISNEALVHW